MVQPFVAVTDLSIVYVLTNPAMPGLVKIGRTSSDDAGTRLAQLYTTGVPFPFHLEFACRVPNSAEVEAALHRAFAPQRVNARREFFQIDPEQAIAILRLLHVEDATATIELQPDGLDQQDIAAAQSFVARRPNLNFTEMGIPIGSELVHVDGEATVIVAGPKRVLFGDREMSLTAATREVEGLAYSVAPGPYWSFNGKMLSEIYNETYSRT